MQVMLRKQGDAYVTDRMLRASDFDGALGETNNPDWKTIVLIVNLALLSSQMAALVSVGVRRVNGTYLKKCSATKH